MLETIYDITTMEEFKTILENNPRMVLIKFSASWCSPCKKVEKHVIEWFNKMPDNIQTVIVDIDNCIDVYGFLKTKKMLVGIPTILMYKKNNIGYIFDDSVSGSNPTEYDLFFTRCLSSQV